MQIAGARVGFGAIARLHGNPAGPLDGHVERLTGVLQHPRARVPPGAAVDRIGPRGQPGTRDLLRLKGAQVGAKARGVGIGQVRVVGGLGVENFLRARHRHVDQTIHCCGFLLVPLRSDQPCDGMPITVWVIWFSVETISALAWKARCAVIISTSWVVMSTFELSSEPDCTVPTPAPPA